MFGSRRRSRARLHHSLKPVGYRFPRPRAWTGFLRGCTAFRGGRWLILLTLEDMRLLAHQVLAQPRTNACTLEPPREAGEA